MPTRDEVSAEPTLATRAAARADRVALGLPVVVAGFISQMAEDRPNMAELHGMYKVSRSAPLCYANRSRPEDIFGSLEVDGSGKFVDGDGKYQPSGKLPFILDYNKANFL